MKRSAHAAVIAAVTSMSVFVNLAAQAYPANVFATPGAVPTPQQGKETNPSFQSDRVDSSGAATLRIPLPTAPNRNGQVPNLALAYSSKNPVRGGLAMGWTLELPRIEVDTSKGTLQEVRYRASEGGRLIRVDEPVGAGWTAYRGEEDGSFTRFERKDGEPATQWRARRTDGSVLYFGESDASRDLSNAVSASDAHEGRWHVTRSVDKFGNEIRYDYEKVMGYAPEGESVPVDIALVAVSYGANAIAGLTHHSTLHLDYAPIAERWTEHCDVGTVPIGALMDFRTGMMIYKGAARLTRVRLETRDANGTTSERRRLDLQYDQEELECRTGVAHAPLRILTGVTETAFAANGTATVLPSQTFEYNRLERTFDGSRSVGSWATRGRRGDLSLGPDRRDATDQMLVDVDGDGLLDRLKTGEATPNGRCSVTWERGLPGAFAPAAQLADDAFMGLAWASPQSEESCALSHQWVDLGAAPPMCLPPGVTQPAGGAKINFQFRDWNHDGLTDLSMGVDQKVCTGVGPNRTCRVVYEKACDGYVARIRYNQGDGTFSAPETLQLPQPLDPEQGWNGDLASSYVDFDGDGWDDAVSLVRDVAHTYNVYHVRINLRDGTFSEPVVVSLPLVEGMDWDQSLENEAYGLISLAPTVGRNDAHTEKFLVGDGEFDEQETNFGSTSYTTGELRDLNGDGLVDYLFSRGGGARVLFNRGQDFKPYLGVPLANRGHLFLDATQPDFLERSVRVNKLRVLYPGAANAPGGVPVEDDEWFSRSTLRAVDFDADGLIDLVKLPEPSLPDSGNPSTWSVFEPELDESEQAELFLNLGDHFVSVGTSVALDRAKHGLSHRVEGGVGILVPWATKSDFVDLDGDGLPEAVNGTRARYDADDQPLRTLKAHHNGRGGHTSYRYRAIVGEGTPHVLWVVDRTSSRADVGAELPDPEMITAYAYAGPVYGPDPDGEYGFRGFSDVTTTLPSGAYRIESRDYSQSYRGLAVSEEVYAIDGSLVSHTGRSFETRTLFSEDAFPGEVTTFHPVVEDTRNCTSGQSYMQCLGSGDRRHVERGYVALAPANGGVAARQLLQWERTGPVPGAVRGNEIAWHVPTYTSSATSYLDHPAGVAKLVYDAANIAQQASAIWHYYDTSKRCEFWTTRNIDTTTYAVTTRVCDLTTGNVYFEMSPRFFGANGPGRISAYDADQRFVTAVTNELGHVRRKTWDAATGTQLSERGPNAKGVSGTTVLDGWESDVDGLGRELRRRVYLDDAALGYRAEEISRNTYFDPAGQPSRGVAEKRIDVGGSRWAKTEVISDALGRTIVERAYESGAVRAETRRFYDAAGQVARAKLPRPGAFDLQFVEWQYAYDSLGRMVEVREPSRAGCTGAIGTTGACGRRWQYSGRTSTEFTATGTLGGQIAKSRSTLDAFGRLSKVEEILDGGAWATTRYVFDGNGNVRETTNADGVVTVMEHDQLGRRIGVTRGPNTWRFGYDANSNLTSVKSPVPAGAIEADYVTTLAYDALNRETVRSPAKRGWTTPELDAFGSGTVTTMYDAGTNGLGRVSNVEVDWGNPDKYQTSYSYDARGLVSRETHGFTLLEGAYADSRTLTRTYSAQGLPVTSTEADGDDVATSTELVTTYDTRGLPSVTYWTGHGWTQQVRRFADGRAFHRYWSTGGVVQAEGNTAFDDVGRVTWLNVRSKLPGDAGPTPRVAQVYLFDGAGDVTQLDSVFAPGAGTPEAVTAVYGYDSMHRLVSATGDRGYVGSFAYSPGGRITKAAVSANADAVRVSTRDVTYRYPDQMGGLLADPDAPVELVNNDVPGSFMNISYDRAGNAVERTIAGATREHLYDGLDRQRQVIAPDGSRELHYYGPDGMRALLVTVDADNDVQKIEWRFGSTEIEYDGDGNVHKTVATSAIDGAAVRVVDRDHHELVFQDPRSHAIATIGEDGAMLAGFSYGPYGELLRAFGSETEEHLRRFNGKPWDATSGLSYYGYRYYDEASLTWTQADPKFRWSVDAASDQPRHAALYAFSNGNPVSLVDPNGLQVKSTNNPPKSNCVDCTAKEEQDLIAAKALLLAKIANCTADWCNSESLREAWADAVEKMVITVPKTAGRVGNANGTWTIVNSANGTLSAIDGKGNTLQRADGTGPQTYGAYTFGLKTLGTVLGTIAISSTTLSGNGLKCNAALLGHEALHIVQAQQNLGSMVMRIIEPPIPSRIANDSYYKSDEVHRRIAATSDSLVGIGPSCNAAPMQ